MNKKLCKRPKILQEFCQNQRPRSGLAAGGACIERAEEGEKGMPR